MYTHTTQKQHLTKNHSRHSSRIARKVSRAAQTKEARERNLAAVQHSQTIQAKLTIDQPNDVYEQEADRVAEQVMHMPEQKVQRQVEKEDDELVQTKPLAETITSLVQRQTDNINESEKEDEELVQTKAEPGHTPAIPSRFSDNINAMRGGGQPMSASSREFFESRFGADFSAVRLHTNANAAQTASDIHARAFTVGKDIALDAGQYAPETSEGKKLLAHELTHVVQQGKKSNKELQRQQAVIQDPSIGRTDLTQGLADWSQLKPEQLLGAMIDSVVLAEIEQHFESQEAKDVAYAIYLSRHHVEERLQHRISEHLDKIVSNLGIAAVLTLATVVASTVAGGLVGLALGAYVGNPSLALAGLLQGGTMGFSLSLIALEWLGLLFLGVWLETGLLGLGGAYAEFLVSALAAKSDPRKLQKAAYLFADALALTVAFALEGLLFFALAKGTKAAMQRFRASNLGQLLQDKATKVQQFLEMAHARASQASYAKAQKLAQLESAPAKLAEGTAASEAAASIEPATLEHASLLRQSAQAIIAELKQKYPHGKRFSDTDSIRWKVSLMVLREISLGQERVLGGVSGTVGPTAPPRLGRVGVRQFRGIEPEGGWLYDVTMRASEPTRYEMIKITVPRVGTEALVSKSYSKTMRAALHEVGLISEGMDAGHVVGRGLAPGERPSNFFDEGSHFNRTVRNFQVEAPLRNHITEFGQTQDLRLEVEVMFADKAGVPEVISTTQRLVNNADGIVVLERSTAAVPP